jgi:serine/threonine protein kinase/Tfp pilus assembly protein PilF
MAIACPKCQADNPETQKFCGECGTQIIPSPEESAATETIETPKDELTTGATFAGRYQIIEELGRGGMGRVYKVLDTEVNERIALKLITPEISIDKKTIERFRNELKLARKIRHKNVCQMYDLSREEGNYYITMEYVAGEDLRVLIIKMGQLSASQAISIAKQVCEGLAEAHKLGVVHRDLKPSNIMIDKEGNARIMDFGIARSLEAKSITAAGKTIGTPKYMSPEQVEGKDIDRRSDIYSLGVILYEMVTGQVPFKGDTPFIIGIKQKSETPVNPKELNDQIPDDLSRAILKCLEKDKQNRFQSAGDLLSELTRIEKGIPSTERLVPKKRPITSKEITVSFSLKKLIIPALFVVALVIAVVIIWQRLPRKKPIRAPKIENSIAVISFENQTGDRSYDYLQRAIPNLLITSLEQTGYLYVATWERMLDLLKQIGKEDVEIIERDLGFTLCRMEGIKSIVLGSFTKAGNMFVTDVKVLDAETKKLLKSASSRGIGEQSILEKQIDELSMEISTGMGIAKKKIEESQLQIVDVTTSSMEAYKYYIKGREEWDRSYWQEAQQALKNAIEIDPTFASAYILLTEVYTGMRNLKARDESVKKAKLYSDKASEKEKLHIDVWYSDFIERNQKKKFDTLKKLVQKYPREKRFHMDLADHYSDIKSEKAIEEYQKALELDPSFRVALNQIGYAYALMREDYERAISYFEQNKSLYPEDANPFDSTGDIYFFMGKLDEAISEYKKALMIKPDFYFSKIKLAYILALKEDYSGSLQWINQFIAEVSDPGMKAIGYVWQGFFYYWIRQFGNATNNLNLAVEFAKTAENKKLEVLADLMKGWINYDKGEFELSTKCFENIGDSEIPFRRILYSLGTGYIALRQDQLDLAKANLSEMNSVLPQLVEIERNRARFYSDQFYAKILLKERAIENAVQIGEKAAPLGKPYSAPYLPLIEHNLPFQKDVLAQVYQQKGELDRAIAEYERLIKFDPEHKERWLIHPEYYYRLALLYEQKDWKGKAIEHYEKFLDLWKDADPGTAEVEDAKKRLAGLM